MSHVASNARQSSLCGWILFGEESRVNELRKIKQGVTARGAGDSESLGWSVAKPQESIHEK